MSLSSKVWDEQWKPGVLRPQANDEGPAPYVPAFSTDDGTFEAEARGEDDTIRNARAQLAAAAPDMAKLLRYLRGNADPGSGARGCAFCRATEGQHHDMACQIVRVLWKAGAT